MKYILTFSLSILFLQLGAQITFEEVTPPDDFSLRNVLKSPLGEYFVQPENNRRSIYRSPDGENWTLMPTQTTVSMHEMQFYTDDTPVLMSEHNHFFIEREDGWNRMHLESGWSPAKAMRIKEDSLFAYKHETFSYSVDKGLSYSPLFTFPESIADYKTDMWVTNEHFIIYTAELGVTAVSVFTRAGARVLHEITDLTFERLIFNAECEMLLMYDENDYYRLSASTLELTTGSLDDLLPDYNADVDFYATNGNWYARQGELLLQSSGCDFDWTTIVDDPMLAENRISSMTSNGNLLLADYFDDYFTELVPGTSTFTEREIAIDYATTMTIDEASPLHQAVSTRNHFFTKTLADQDWAEILSDDFYARNSLAYAPGGDLYVLWTHELLYSTDNGQTFSTITAPGGAEIEKVKVLDDQLLFIELSDSRERYYSRNNGGEWTPLGLTPAIYGDKVALAGDELFIVDLGSIKTVTKVNLNTQETVEGVIEGYDILSNHKLVFREDGTIFYYIDSYDTSESDLYSYTVDAGSTYLGNFPELNFSEGFFMVGYDFYVMQSEHFYIVNGSIAESYDYEGLPDSPDVRFSLAANDHLYAIIDDHRIFRSTMPLTFPQTVFGTVYHDINEDCATDTDEAGLVQWHVRMEGDDFLQIKPTNELGQFNFSVPAGDYTVSAQLPSANWGICEPSFELTIEDDNANYTQDFRAQTLVDCAELEFDFSTPFLRRCFDNYYTVRVRNSGPLASAGTTLTLELDPFFELLSAELPYTQSNDTEFAFDLGVLQLDEEVVFRIYFNLSCEADLGQQHCVRGTLTDTNTCVEDITEYQECQGNIGSYDPNDKRIFNQSGEEATGVDIDEYIYYHIRFQNTGTDTAFRVRVVDPLSAKLDLSTLAMLSVSHPYTYEITDGPALVVTFDDILLPDSTTNELASHGFFRFKVKPLPEYGYGTEITNQAGIYFDFNDPIITNEAVLKIQEPVRLYTPWEQLDFGVYPNPAAETITLLLPPTLKNQPDTFELLDATGALVMNGKYPGAEELNVSRLPRGVYQVLLREKGLLLGTEKFVKI